MIEPATLLDFEKQFDIVDNALNMRALKRWNGRDLRENENLAEHTHLVTACLIKLYDELKELNGHKYACDFETIIKYAMLHDSLELFRGDILSTTKDNISGLRQFVDDEEKQFLKDIIKFKLNDYESELVKLADLMACYKFVEYELRYPSNEFAKEAYTSTKKKFDEYYNKFLHNYFNMDLVDVDVEQHFSKGYADDAGTDIILDRDITFLPMNTTNVELNVNIVPERGEMAFLCARTSAASKGLSVATCPIDPFYSGNVSAIVHNVSNDVITYRKGESFCQYIKVKIITDNDTKPRKQGQRTISKYGGTDK